MYNIAPKDSFSNTQERYNNTFSLINIIPIFPNVAEYQLPKLERYERQLAKYFGKLNVLNIITYNRKNIEKIDINTVIKESRRKWSVKDSMKFKTSEIVLKIKKIKTPEYIVKVLFNKEKKYLKCFKFFNDKKASIVNDKLKDHEIKCDKKYLL